MLKRAAAWFCLLAGGALNIELLLTGGRVNFIWLLLFGIAALYFQRNGLFRPKPEPPSDKEATEL